MLQSRPQEDNEAMTRFKKRTAVIKSNNSEVIQSRRTGGQAFSMPQLSKGCVFKKHASGPDKFAVQHLLGLARWRILDLCREPAPSPNEAGRDVRFQRTQDNGILTFAAQCHLVIADNLADFAVEETTSRSWAKVACTVAAFGRAVVSKDAWVAFATGSGQLTGLVCHRRALDVRTVLIYDPEPGAQEASDFLAKPKARPKFMARRGRPAAAKIVKLQRAAAAAVLWQLFKQIRSLDRAAGVSHNSLG
ncbi:unnamed protein product [Symbiodinium natans]|uniref:Uncharacterized protein n=1 Tax=Symbiodinium natans TaxID=878477 RepID=A0A812J5Z5_9DINO|nr:unnamed protein product [Symbiodinium natans]